MAFGLASGLRSRQLDCEITVPSTVPVLTSRFRSIRSTGSRQFSRNCSMAISSGAPKSSKSELVLNVVKPFQKVPHVDVIHPTLYDLMASDSFIPLIFTYRLAENSDKEYEHFVDTLKESLQKVLIPFFPFAGRWVQADGGRGRELLCNDEGIPFMEAFEDRRLDSVVQASSKFKPVPELNGFATMGYDPSVFRQEPPTSGGHPPIFCKVTRFSCGGMVLGVTFSHIHCDAESFFDFMKAWSDLARTNQTSVQPQFNKELAPTWEGAFKQIQDDPESPLSQFAEIMSQAQPRPSPGTLEDPVSGTFEVKASAIEAIKKDVVQRTGKFVSTTDCIVAHMWQSVARLPSSVTNGKEVVVRNAVEGRQRFYKTPVANLCGNVYSLYTLPLMSREEVQKESLDLLAFKVRDTLQNLKQDYWFSTESIEEMVQYPFSFNTSSWLKYPMYEIDFGVGGGKPIFAGALNTTYNFGIMGVTFISPPIPGHSDSAAILYIWTTSDILDSFTSSDEFLSFFS